MTYLFHRLHDGEPFFYPVAIELESQVIDHVEANPGTIKVTDLDGRVVWSLRAALDAPEYVPLSDARIISLAYDCNAMPESCTDESLKLFARAIEQEVRG